MDFLASYSVALLASVFLLSGIAKLVKRSHLESTLVELIAVPSWLITAITIWLPTNEIIAGLLLLYYHVWSVMIGATMSLILLLLFICITFYAIRNGKSYINCSCFGTTSNSTFNKRLIIRNMALSSLALYLIVILVTDLQALLHLSPDRLSIVVFAVIVTVLIYNVINRLIDNYQRIIRLDDSG